MIYFLFFLLFIDCFLVVLNGFLRGNKTPLIDTVLGGILLTLIVCIFILFGWKTGLISIGSAFIFAMIQYPFAKNASSKLLDKEWVDKNIKPFFEKG